MKITEQMTILEVLKAAPATRKVFWRAAAPWPIAQCRADARAPIPASRRCNG